MRKTQQQLAAELGVSLSTIRRRQAARRYSKYLEEDIAEALALLDEGFSVLEVSNILDIPRSTIYNWKQQR